MDHNGSGADRSQQLERKPLWFRKARAAGVGTLFGLLSIGVLVHLIFLPHWLTAAAFLCFVAAGASAVRTASRDPALPPVPTRGTSARPYLVQLAWLAAVVALFVLGTALWVLRFEALG